MERRPNDLMGFLVQELIREQFKERMAEERIYRATVLYTCRP